MQSIEKPKGDPLLILSLPPPRFPDNRAYPTGVLNGHVYFSPRSLKETSATAGAVVGQDGDDFVEFVGRMLALEPRNRPQARELLETKWLKDV